MQSEPEASVSTNQIAIRGLHCVVDFSLIAASEIQQRYFSKDIDVGGIGEICYCIGHVNSFATPIDGGQPMAKPPKLANLTRPT